MAPTTLTCTAVAEVLEQIATDLAAAINPDAPRDVTRPLYAAHGFVGDVAVALMLVDVFGPHSQVLAQHSATGFVLSRGLAGRDRTAAAHAARSAARLAIAAAETAARHATNPTGSTLLATTYTAARERVGHHLTNLAGAQAVRR